MTAMPQQIRATSEHQRILQLCDLLDEARAALELTVTALDHSIEAGYLSLTEREAYMREALNKAKAVLAKLEGASPRVGPTEGERL